LNLHDDVSTVHEEQSQQPVQILLSNKTGLPLGVLPERAAAGANQHKFLDDFEQQDTFVSVNKGVARKKNETAEERRARKKAVKEERQVARIQKK
jgi:Low temperature viability protein.